MLCRRHTFLIFMGLAFIACTINFHLLSIHHMSSDEIFLTHFSHNQSMHTKLSESLAVAKTTADDDAYSSSCYHPRRLPPLPSKDTLPLPVINLGFPKMGTSSLHAFFGCAGYRSMHFRCNKSYACAECLRSQFRKRKEVNLKECGIADVYSQIDRDDYFPQISLLEQILEAHPNATYFLTFRSLEKWYHSISHWPPNVPDEYLLKNRLLAPGLKFGGNLTDYSEWFCNHVTRVREMVAKFPNATLVEINIEDPTTATYMSDLFDLDRSCWGRANVNFELHEELNEERAGKNANKEKEKVDVKAHGSMPWFIHGKRMIRGKNGVMRLRYQDIPLDILARMGPLPEGAMKPDDNSQVPVSVSPNSTSVVETISLREMDSQTTTSMQSRRSLTHDDYCSLLLAHEKGHWQHTTSDTFPSLMQSNPSIKRLLFPKEMEWMKGRLPWNGFGTCKYEKNMLMYNGIVGHQCGCGVREFQPSLPEWAYDNTITSRHFSNEEAAFHPSWTEYYKSSATLRLARKLANANATLCFAGDSIDYQIYYAMQNNLNRVSQLHAMHSSGSPRIVNVMTREIAVNHTTEPGSIDNWFLNGRRPPDGDGSFVTGSRPPPGGFGSMYSILETKAWFRNENQSDSKLARVRYFMTYGWSPWNIEFMESCNVVVMNIGLHYTPDGDHIGKQTRKPLIDDLRAAITYLANFTSSNENRVSVWRSALPQHFDTFDGHFHGWDSLPKDHSCIDFKPKSTKDQGPSDRQNYNAFYDEVFASMCQQPDGLQQSCSHLKHSCNVDLMSTEFQTIYKYWLDNNCTDKIEREARRLNNASTVTGTILRWNVFDLFDNTKWHSKDMDCTHFCYVPSLYDNAFERLELLVAPSLEDFKDNSNTAESFF